MRNGTGSGVLPDNAAVGEPVRTGVITGLSGVAKDFGLQTQTGVSLVLQDLLREGRGVEIIFSNGAWKEIGRKD